MVLSECLCTLYTQGMYGKHGVVILFELALVTSITIEIFSITFGECFIFQLQ